MHDHDLTDWTHPHEFDAGNPAAERGTRLVVWITLAMMVVEIAAGLAFNSMALLADGMHMSSHAMAIGLSALAYAAARRYAHDPRFAFGTWKMEILGGYTSALLLLVMALLMVWESLQRLLDPQPIRYGEALAVAAVGLVVNLVCARILGHAHQHGDHAPTPAHRHDHPPAPGHRHAHEHGAHEHAPAASNEVQTDLNLRAAHMHVLTDAATSVLALVALAGGAGFGWRWLDPLMGIIGAALIVVWAKSLLLDSGKVLLDREMDHPLVQAIRAAIEDSSTGGHTQVADLHVWRVGRHAYACALGVVTCDTRLRASDVRARLAGLPALVHLTVEVHHREVSEPE